MRLTYLFCFAATFFGSTGLDWELCLSQEALKLTKTTSIEFASKAKAQELLVAKDVFLSRMQPLERQIRLGSKEPVTEEQYLDSLKAGCQEWSKEERENLTEVISSLADKMAGYDLPFPERIFLVRVSKAVEGNAPHCRAATVVLPDKFFAAPKEMPKIMAHELFHVLSSHNRDLRDKLYAIIGFERCEEIELPKTLMPRRLTNPDAPTHEHFITLDQAGEKVLAAPITFTRSEKYLGGGLFQNIDFQIMVLEKQNGKIVPKLENGKPRLLSPREAPDYMRQIGMNTGYIIHPEETLADNFWMLVLSAPGLRDPWVPEKMKELLQK